MTAATQPPDSGRRERELSYARQPLTWNMPPNLFGMSFGLAGLAEVWNTTARTFATPATVADVLNVLAAVVWSSLIATYMSRGPTRVLADLRDPVLAPFVSLAPITGMLLGAALAPHAGGPGEALVLTSLLITLMLGGWLTGQWIAGEIPEKAAHGGYFLPTVAGGFVAATAASAVGLHSLAEGAFGVGIICWLMIGSVLLGRLVFRPSLPPNLMPTLAIEVAPAAVGGVAYFALTGGRADSLSYALAGYTALMVLVQVRLVPLYARLNFGPSFWSFTFPYAAVTTSALDWLALKRPPGAGAYAGILLSVITLFVGVIAVRTILLLARGQLFKPASNRSQMTEDRSREVAQNGGMSDVATTRVMSREGRRSNASHLGRGA